MLTLDESIGGAKQCIDYLLDNDLTKALELCRQLAAHSLYHSHGHSLMLWLKAYLTLEMPEIEAAQEASSQTLELCQSMRSSRFKDTFIYKLFFKTNYHTLSDLEIHAELIHNEQMLCGTLMEFFLDQSIFVLIKVSYRLRSAYLSYKSLAKAVEEKRWQSELSRTNFISGVNLGLGVFNMAFSLLPERFMSLLSMVGYKGSRAEAIRLLKEASFEADCVRSFPAQLLLGFYETFFEQMFSPSNVAAPATSMLIEFGLKINSNCIWYAHFKGKLQMIDNNIAGAVATFCECLEHGRFDVPQLVTLYLWDLMWCSVLSTDWTKAVEYCRRLQVNCTWSAPTFFYMEAAFLYMQFEDQMFKSQRQFATTTEGIELIQQINTLTKKVPTSVKRYAGRRIPLEKFVCEKVENFEKTGHFTLPAYELLFVWNTFIYLEKQEELLLRIIEHADQCLSTFAESLDDQDSLTCNLVRAGAYRLLRHFDQARQILELLERKIDNLPRKGTSPYAPHQVALVFLELGIIDIHQHRLEDGRKHLQRARTHPTSYSLELLIMFRVHKAFQLLKSVAREVS